MKQYSLMLLALIFVFLNSCQDIRESYHNSFNEMAPLLKTPILKIGLEPIRLPDSMAVVRGRAESLRVIPRMRYNRGDTHRIYPGTLVFPRKVKYNDDCELIIPSSINYRVILSDSSRVVVDSDSKLNFRLQFDSSRTVKLRGKALFNVFPERRPFIVQVGFLEVFPLGDAEFDITAYDENKPRIAVIAGIVNIFNGKNSIELKKGHQGLFLNGECVIKPCDSLCDSLASTYKRPSDIGEY